MENEAMASMISWLPIVFMLVIFYFMLYRPQKQARQEREKMLSNLQVGAEVVTIGGIYGKITSLDEDTLQLKIADGVEIKISRQAVNMLVQKDETE